MNFFKNVYTETGLEGRGLGQGRDLSKMPIQVFFFKNDEKVKSGGVVFKVQQKGKRRGPPETCYGAPNPLSPAL